MTEARTQMLPIVSPYDLSAIGDVPLVPWETADKILSDAWNCFHKRQHRIAAHRRIEILHAIAQRVEAAAEELAILITREGGKPIRDARTEVARAIIGIRLAASGISEVMTGKTLATDLSEAAVGRTLHTQREPIGVVLAISAFNHPLNLLIHQVMPAIAVGCPVIVKPALATPFTCLKLMEIIHESGLPEAWCRAILCLDDVSEKMAADPRIAFLSFIGSAKVGWHLRSKLAAGVRCALEHGGNAPVIMLPYANQDEAIPTLLKGGMSHAGQVCVSVQRVYVPWAEGGHFARKLGEAAEQMVVGNPINENTEIGPLISPAQVERVHAWVTEAIAGGAKLMCGGQPISETLYQPTILFDPPATARVTRDEIFGPVICVYGYDEIDDAIRRANDSPYHFQAAVWGRQYDDLQRVIQQLDAATVMVNDHSAFRVDWMPFGGRGKSGLGTGGIPYTMQDYTQEKLVVHRVPHPA